MAQLVDSLEMSKYHKIKKQRINHVHQECERETEPRLPSEPLGGKNHKSILKGKTRLPAVGLSPHDANHRSVLHRHKYTDQTFGVFWTWLEKCV